MFNWCIITIEWWNCWFKLDFFFFTRRDDDVLFVSEGESFEGKSISLFMENEREWKLWWI